MDTSKLKPFAQDARRLLKAQVSARLDQVLAEQSAARREQPKAVSELEAEIAKSDRDQVIEKVAYTWFNRFTALRFMDVNDYTRLKVVSPAEGQTRPEILAEAAAGNIDEDAPADVRNKVAALLDGRTPSRDPQGEAYRLLLVAACNQWHSAMPFMFEKIADYTELLMPEDLLSADSILAKARTAMTEEACKDVEVIGWLYQFYISEKKDEVFAGLKKNKKITADNIPAATQLFTPHWIVRYLLENSLGRLWLLNRPNSKLAAQMEYYIAPEDPETDFVRISRPEEIRICDPACGSGHMLTYAFDLLYAIYEEEGYETTEIPGLILAHNLHGIEIDERAGALAAFALAMKAATKLGRRRFLRQAAQPNICVLQDVRFTSSEMQDVAALVGRELFTAEFRETMGQFEQAKNLGSLILPKLRNPAEATRVAQLKDFGGDLLLRELQERVLKVLEMAETLSPRYHVVVANPPYMGGKGMNAELVDFAKSRYPDSKSDLFAMFMERSLRMNVRFGLMAMINMQSWMFLSSFEKLREKLLKNSTILSMAHLGERSFDTIGGSVVSTTAFVCFNGFINEKMGDFIRLVDGLSESEKSRDMRNAINNRDCGLFYRAAASEFNKIPGSPMTYWLPRSVFKAFSEVPPISDRARAAKGLVTADNETFVRLWHEVSQSNVAPEGVGREEGKLSGKIWFRYAKGGEFRKWYGNFDSYVNWQNDGYKLQNTLTADGTRVRATNFNLDRIFKSGMTWTVVTTGKQSFRYLPDGCLFDAASGVCQTKDPDDELTLLGFLNSRISAELLAAVNPTLNLHPGYLEALPFCRPIDKGLPLIDVGWLRDASKNDWDSMETSWDFKMLPLISVFDHIGSLADSYNTLRSQWRDVTVKMQALEVENNRIFIEAYGLGADMSDHVPLHEVTLTCNPAYRYGTKSNEDELESRLLADTVAEFLHYSVGCMFGRYSLDEPGLILANQGEGLADYLARVPQPTFEPDADNVIPVLDGDWFADDIVERFRKFLRVTFGEEKFQENLSFIESALGKDIRKWFTRDFYEYHVRRFKKRPIYWMFASPKGSFQALIYMHRYRPDTVSVVLNDYLREYRNKLEAHRKSLEALSSSSDALPAQRTKAEKDIGEVTKVIGELDAYERDVLFPLATQKIGIDLDDGVKTNYPKFGDALKPIKGLSDADD